MKSYSYSLRTCCSVIGWFDIVFGHTMVLVYIALMYSGYFYQDNGLYWFVLCLDFAFSIAQLIGGALLVYGLKQKSQVLVFLSSWFGIVLILVNIISAALLSISVSDVSLSSIVMSCLLLFAFVCIRGCASTIVFMYYRQLKDELCFREKLISSVPEFVQILT